MVGDRVIPLMEVGHCDLVPVVVSVEALGCLHTRG